MPPFIAVLIILVKPAAIPAALPIGRFDIYPSIPFLSSSRSYRHSVSTVIPFLSSFRFYRHSVLVVIPFLSSSRSCRHPVLAVIPFLPSFRFYRHPVLTVIPAQAGIRRRFRTPGFHRSDGPPAQPPKTKRYLQGARPFYFLSQPSFRRKPESGNRSGQALLKRPATAKPAAFRKIQRPCSPRRIAPKPRHSSRAVRRRNTLDAGLVRPGSPRLTLTLTEP